MKKTLFLISILLTGCLYGQTGGQSTFQLLNFATTARSQALGGFVISVKDQDVSLAIENPALLNREQHGQLNLNYINYFADGNFGFFSYAKHYNGIGTFNLSLQYANYGKFKYAAIDGEQNGSTFTANDVAISLGYGRRLSNRWSVGGQTRIISSFYESYNAFGASMDVGFAYSDTAKGIGLGFLVKNTGLQFNGYNGSTKESLPFNLMVGVSKRLAHAPFRFSLTYDNIQRFNLIYFDDSQTTSIDPLTGDIIEIKPPSALSKIAYHLHLGTEILLGDNFQIRFGYNHMTRQTLKVGAKPGFTGFSLGFGMKVKKLNISYAMGKYHIAGTSNHITISKRFGKVPELDSFYQQFD